MAWYVYSPETIPNPEMFGKPGYTPEWLVWNGIQLPILTAGEWTKLPEGFRNVRHQNWKDRAGTAEYVETSGIMKAVESRWGRRGIVALDHEPTADEKTKIHAQAKRSNEAFRMKAIEFYEREADKSKARQGEYFPSPYVDECYELLGLVRPYSVEAMRAQRHPGEAVGEQIVAALGRLEQRRANDAKPPGGKQQPRDIPPAD
jgi:hypothetical protein